MAVDMQLLKLRGVSSGSYKKIFSGNPANYPPRIRKLVDLVANRSRRGIESNLQEWRAYAAIDTAYDVPFQQTTPTLIRNIVNRHWDNADELKAALDGWGLNQDNLFIKEKLPDGREALLPNTPVFYGILIPLVKAYVTIRLAKIFNERNQSPILRYKPLKATARNQVLCDIMTDIAETMSTWYGYPAVMRQAIQQMLKYGVSMTFTVEEWHCEQQEMLAEDGTERTETVKEGLRYITPHPTRTFYDLSYPLTSINSDTGITWCGHWTLRTFGEVFNDRRYWNRKSIMAGTNWFQYGYGANYYFEEFFPCVMASAYNQRFASSVAPPTREERVSWYNDNDMDQALFQVEHFMKLTPSEWGLGRYDGITTKDSPIGKLIATYNKPVWHRFTLAGDDTVIWCEPMAYTPAWFMGYHYDAQSARQDSLGLQTIPWQDLLGDLLNHIVDVAKQNLANCTFYDTNVVDKPDIERIQKLGSRLYRGWNFVAFDSLLQQRAGADPRAAFYPVRFEKQSIVELLQALPVVLQIMERVLQIAAQEVGSAASHQQGKQEILQIGSASQNGVLFTASYVDEGIDAWMRQIHQGSLAYLDTMFLAQVSADIENLTEHIQALGFEEKGRGKNVVLVRGNKSKLRLEGFAASNQGPAINKDKETSQVIFTLVSTIASQPELFKRVGAKNCLFLLQQAAIMAGAPRDLELNMPPEGEQETNEVPPEIIQAIQAAQQATIQAVGEKVAKPSAEAIAQDGQRIQALEAIVKKFEGIFEMANQAQDRARIEQEKTAAKLHAKAIETAAAIERKQLETQAGIQRKSLETQANIELKRQEAELEAQIKTAEASHDAAIATKQAEHAAQLAEKTAKAKPKSKAE